MNYWSERQIMEGELGFRSPPGRNVCAYCVFDEALKRLVNENLAAMRCDFCEREADKEIAADTDVVLAHISTSLRTEYADANDELIPDKEDGGWSGGVATYTTEEVLEIVADRPLGHPEFDAFALDAFREMEWTARDPFGFTEGEALAYGWAELCDTVQHRQRFLFFQEQTRPEDDPGWSVPRGAEMLAELGRLIVRYRLVVDLDAGSRLYRVRPHGTRKRYKSAKDLGSPPVEYASQSRMSPAGVAMFYAADEPQTALDETVDSQTRVGAATISTWRSTETARIVDLSLLPKQPSIFDDRPESREQWGRLGFLHGFEREVSRPIKRDDRIHTNYVPTQVVCEFLRDRFRDADDQPVRGLAWDSSRRPGSRNVVLFIDRNRCVEIDEQPSFYDGLLVELVGSELIWISKP